jgi:two-component system LytT family response regulator
MTAKTQILPIKRGLISTSLMKEPFSKSIAIAMKNEIRVIDINNIIYLKSNSNYTEIYLRKGIRILASNTLKRYETKLDSKQFFRVHNSYIINKSHLTSYLIKESSVILYNNHNIPVARSKKKVLFNYLRTITV